MSNANINLSINATANLASTTAALEAMRRGMSSVRDEVNKYHRSLQTTGKEDRLGFQKALNNVDALRSGYGNLIEQSGLYNRSMKNITSATTDFNNRLMKQKIGLKDVVGQFGLVRSAMKEQMALNRMMVQGWRKDATGKIQADLWVPKTIDLKTMASMRAQMGYYNEILKSVSTNMINLGKNTQWAGRQLTVGFSVPISIAAGLLGKLGAAADAELVRIVKVYGDTESAFQASNDSLRNMAQETARYIAEQYGIAASETRNVMAELAATGLEGPELQKMTVSTQRLSLLGDTSPDESLKLMRVLKEVYGFSSAELDKQVDYFNAIENATALTMQDVVEGLPRISGIMKATGVSIQEQTELLVAFKSAGIDVAEGANALKSINFKAVAATPTAAKYFFQITGVEMQDLIDKTEGQFIPMMMEIANVMKDLDQQAKVDLVARVFGIHQGSRAITLLEQLQNQSEGLLRAQEVGLMSVEERAATANKEIQAIQESAGVRFKRMIAEMKASLEPLGILVLEAIIPVGNVIAGLLEKINSLSERTKKIVVFGSILLAAFGPLVMFVGLMGNLIGTGVRATAFLAGLAVKFNLLSAEGEAAAKIQKALDSEMNKAVRTMHEETIALGGLTKAINDYTRAMTKAGDTAAASSSVKWSGPLALEPLPKKRTWVGTQTGLVDTVEHQKRSVTRKEYQAAWDEALIENSNRKIAEHNELVEKSKGKWVAVGGSIAAASAAVHGLASITGSEWLSKLSYVTMLAGSFGPLFGTLSKNVADSFTKMGAASNKTVAAMGTGFKAFGAGAKTVLSGLASFMLGPWGLAIGGAVAGVIAIWNHHKKQVQEMQEMYQGLSNSAELLGKSYNFQPMTKLERDMSAPGYDANSMSAHKARIEEMKRSNTELYDLIEKRSENIRENYKGEARSREYVNEAMKQGAQVLRNTGDVELAKQVAWDMYNAMSNEWMSFDAFEIKFGANFESLYGLAEQVAEVLRGRIGQMDLNIAWTGNLNKEYLEQVKADTAASIESIMSIPDTAFRNDALRENLTELTKMQEIFFDAQKNGWINADTTFLQFSTNFTKYRSKLTAEGNLTGVTAQESQLWEAIAQAVNEADPTAMDSVSQAGMDIIEAMSGLGPLYRENIDQIKLSRLEEELFNATTEETKKSVQDQIDLLKQRAWMQAMGVTAEERAAEASKQGLRMINTALGGLSLSAHTAKDSVVGTGEEGADAMGELADKTEEAKSALDSLTDSQRMKYDAFKTSMEDLQKNTVDYYRQQMNQIHDAERKAFDEQAEVQMKVIEDKHDAIEKAADKNAKLRQDRLDQRHEIQKKALDAEKEAAMELMDERRDRLKVRQDRESEALSERYKRLNNELKESQEARRKQIESTYDKQIDAINRQIEKEEELEKHRQRMFEAEKQRINRMQQLFSQNIDLNMAVNTGDLDEAAKIASQMAAQQSEWATDDLSQISSDASESRRDKMRGQIDKLEDRKKSELDKIKAVEDAELESLKKREDAANKALKAKFKRLEDELAAERKMLDKSFKLRSENLSKRQRKESDVLSETLAAEREQRSINRKEDVSAQEARTAKSRAELDKRLSDAAKAFEDEASYWEQMVATNATEWSKGNRRMFNNFKQVLGVDLKKMDQETTEDLWKKRQSTQTKELRKMANAEAWKDAAKKIVDDMTSSIMGMTMSASQMETFLRTGKLPKPKKTTGKGHVSTGSYAYGGRDVKHSGGVAGVDAPSYTGPGFTGRHQEIDATLLKGEGVLNLRAMNTPGVPEMMHALNKGYTKKSPIASYTDFKGKASSRPGGASGLGYPVMAALTAGIAKQFARVATLTGLEVGMNKAESQSASNVNIKLGKNEAQGMTAEQLANASAIISTGRRLGASDRDIITALMTAMQESSMRNLGYGDDIYGVRNPDGSLTSSLGLFQQQKWWGSRGERLDPNKSSELFYNALFGVNNRDSMPLWAAAQSVQRSAYPQAYAKWESLARVLLGGAQADQFSPVGKVNSQMSTQDRLKALKKRYETLTNGFMYPTTGMISWLYGWRNMSAMGRRDFHNGIDIRAAGGTPVYAVAPGRASIGWDSYGGGNFVKIDHGNGIGTGYFHLSRKVAKPGQQVQRGTYIGQVGNTGKLSFGNHLHFSAFRNGAFTDPAPFMNEKPAVGKYVRPQNMRVGGLVPGQGFGDITPAMLEPGEFVVRKTVTDNNRALLSALNNGSIDLNRKSANIDNSRASNYNINMNFHGPVNKEIHIERAVKNAINTLEKRKTQNRNLT